ncbi:hypothetical protein [Candidatus Electronema sp. JM]|uniref:hypothetical protein n=1 Tax=Candidatus Electronema sp. JM TaxID=3401571 RepID=UPI003AA89A55
MLPAKIFMIALRHSFDSHDRKYLAELMQNFPVTHPISLDAAIERIKDFCNSQLPAEDFAEALKKLPPKVVESFFQAIPEELHKQLFDGILSNAGEYRKATDPNKVPTICMTLLSLRIKHMSARR